MTLNRQESGDPARLQLSALMDGEHGPDELSALCQAWRTEPSLRSDWHAYHLIGDVLRSQDLAAPAAHDAAFLSALRLRLADEPVPLAPAPVARPVVQTVGQPVVQTAARRRKQWLMAPVAVAAGFVAVAGVLVVLRSQEAASPAPAAGVLATAPAEAADPVRDARLASYLRAHRQLSNAGAMAVMPGGAVRSVDAVVFEAK
jgi:sigma-E factor negative regulatory protein RseA